MCDLCFYVCYATRGVVGRGADFRVRPLVHQRIFVYQSNKRSTIWAGRYIGTYIPYTHDGLEHIDDRSI